jgi:hypothetical protein
MYFLIHWFWGVSKDEMLRPLAFYSGIFPIIPSWVSEEFLLKNQHRYL